MHALIFVLSFLFTINESPVTTMNDYTGEWVYKVDTPQGPYQGVIVLEKAFDGYTGEIVSGDVKIEMTDVKVEGNKMKFNIVVDGFPVAISGTFEGNKYTAVCSVEGMEIPLVATKKE